ncbi:hypothetical protein LXL04_034251 [Taraxacum kok-saghyz]
MPYGQYDSDLLGVDIEKAQRYSRRMLRPPHMDVGTETKPSSPPKSDDLGGRASTFFFTNFPENWGEDKLWHEFRKFGTVVDVFVATKRNKVGRKFGFARFMKVRDIEKLEMELNNSWWDRFKLKANLAKYGRKDQKVAKALPQKLKSVVVGQYSVEHERPTASHVGAHSSGPSYAAAVSGRDKVQADSKNSQDNVEANLGNSIHVIPSPDLIERLNRSLLGEVKCFEILKNLQELPKVEGLNEVKVSYYGGMSVLLEFRTKDAAKKFLTLARGTWTKWFRALDSWSPEKQTLKRLASLHIVGIPPHAWMSCVFSDIGSIWGEIVVPEWCNSELRNRERGNVIILTQVSNFINETVELVVQNMRFKVMVTEDFIESGKLGPNLDVQFVNEEDDDSRGNDSDCDDSRCDENSIFESVGDDILDFHLNGEDGHGIGTSGVVPSIREAAEETGRNKGATTPVSGTPEVTRTLKENAASPQIGGMVNSGEVASAKEAVEETGRDKDASSPVIATPEGTRSPTCPDLASPKVAYQLRTHCPSREEARAGNGYIPETSSIPNLNNLNLVGQDVNYQHFGNMGPLYFSPSHFITETSTGPRSLEALSEQIISRDLSDTSDTPLPNYQIQEDFLLEEKEKLSHPRTRNTGGNVRGLA